MKELTIEEKAKAYDKAINTTRNLVKAGLIYEDAAIQVFPELVESEDEKIREALIDMVKCAYKRGVIILGEKEKEKYITWLEKQDSHYTFEIKKGHWYKCVCDYMLNDSDLMFKNDRLYYCRSDWRLGGEIDERNVKDIGVNGYKSFFRPATNQEIKDWLEKQGEQKPADKVEPKFKIGDWVVRGKTIAQILDIQEQYYVGLDIDGNDFTSSRFLSDDKIHLWTIQDAKDGDVLACKNGWTCIFKTLVNNETFSSYCFMDNTKWFCETGSECHTLKEEFVKVYNGKIYPATKEQRDLLFQKMKEAGYKWDDEKKELKKIEPKFNIGDKIWHKNYKGECIHHIIRIENDNYIGDDNTSISILTADKEYELVEKQDEQKSSWSKDDETYLNTIVSDLNYSKAIHNKAKCNFIDKEIKWFKSLKNRVQPQPKQEWNEKDKEMYKKVETAINSYYAPFSRDTEEMSEWFKNLKDRVQLKWKPSDRQMKALKEVCNELWEPDGLDPLYVLWEQLKKLREE